MLESIAWPIHATESNWRRHRMVSHLFSRKQEVSGSERATQGDYSGKVEQVEKILGLLGTNSSLSVCLTGSPWRFLDTNDTHFKMLNVWVFVRERKQDISEQAVGDVVIMEV